MHSLNRQFEGASQTLFENQIPKRLLASKELAERLGIDDKKVYRLVNAGAIPGIRVGGQWRFHWEEVLSALRKGSANGNERS